ncbi:MAG: hypothetical protein Q9183_006078 [Haloplaca sp. 2 TL-2023]
MRLSYRPIDICTDIIFLLFAAAVIFLLHWIWQYDSLSTVQLNPSARCPTVRDPKHWEWWIASPCRSYSDLDLLLTILLSGIATDAFIVTVSVDSEFRQRLKQRLMRKTKLRTYKSRQTRFGGGHDQISQEEPPIELARHYSPVPDGLILVSSGPDTPPRVYRNRKWDEEV